jgi:hypothetical protein
MKRTLLALVLSLSLVSAARPAPSDGEVEARKRALELAGAFSNDGFKIRDGNWCGSLKAGTGKVIQVNLYAGNQYWFSAAATDGAKKLKVTVFEEAGAPQESLQYPDELASTAAAGFSPTASGVYYVKVEELEGEAASFCLLCSYK